MQWFSSDVEETAMNVQRGSKDRSIKALQWNKTQMIDALTLLQFWR